MVDFLEPLISPQSNAALQVIIFALLVVGIGVKWKKKFQLHGILMLIAVIFNLISFFLVMFPSLIRMEIIALQPFQTISVMAIIHSSVGLVAIVLGLWLVGSWHLQSPRTCFKNKKLMRLTSTLWMIVLLGGFVLYYLLNF